jgi:molecular chaperone HscC
VATLHPNQTEVIVKIYQGESRRVEQNLFLGEFVAQGIPPGPAGQPVEIRFTYDLNGVLEVEATIVGTRQKVSHVITRHARGLSRAQLERAVKEMAKLKTHPREESANRLLLRRAERLFQELPLVLRDDLTFLLEGFESALSLQDPAVIERHRTALELFLSQHDSGAAAEENDRDDLG